ncbi:helix-turn-helix domain-containing protein [Bradyrhizobium ottawaense]|uniref:helix-turn-helix domain-containing protein n=1 Tax=Bradyrhizobium ottawaense TaxID=931866 RepID=UPI0035112DE4
MVTAPRLAVVPVGAQHVHMLNPPNNGRVEMPAGDDNSPKPYGSLKISDCFRAEAELLTAAEVAKLLRISISSVRRPQQRRRISFLKVGGSIRFAKHDVIFYLAKQRTETIDK